MELEALIRDALSAIYKAKKTLEKVSITFGQESVYQFRVATSTHGVTIGYMRLMTTS